MKKVLKLAAALCAGLVLGAGFLACSNDDDDSGGGGGTQQGGSAQEEAVLFSLESFEDAFPVNTWTGGSNNQKTWGIKTYAEEGDTVSVSFTITSNKELSGFKFCLKNSSWSDTSEYGDEVSLAANEAKKIDAQIKVTGQGSSMFAIMAGESSTEGVTIKIENLKVWIPGKMIDASAGDPLPIKKEGWTWGYNASLEDTDEGLKITLTSNYGAGSFGYTDGEDWSAYKTLELEYKVACGAEKVDDEDDLAPWVQLIADDGGTGDAKKSASATGTEGEGTVILEISGLPPVKQVQVQGKRKGDVIIVKSLVLKK